MTVRVPAQSEPSGCTQLFQPVCFDPSVVLHAAGDIPSALIFLAIAVAPQRAMPSYHRRDDAACDASGNGDAQMGLRVASIFVILAGGLFGAFFPILARKIRAFARRPAIWEYVGRLTFLCLRLTSRLCRSGSRNILVQASS
jgi:hypothetical protein